MIVFEEIRNVHSESGSTAFSTLESTFTNVVARSEDLIGRFI